MAETAGCWYVDGHWTEGICTHDGVVQSIKPVATGKTGCTLPRFLPAPVDLHVHGGGGHDVMHGAKAIRGALRCHAAQGTGSLLLTSVTAPFEEISRFLADAQAVMADPAAGEATVLGVHLEGPFISPDRLGAQPPYACAVEAEQLERWLATGIVRVITFAPEIQGADDLLALCQHYQVRAQIGHTNCHWSVAQRALLAGCGVTHLYNAMTGVSHRQAGAAAAALANADYAEIITDGVHVERIAFDAAVRAIPHLYSVTDATAAAGMPDGQYQLGFLDVIKQGGSVRLPDGTLAGSCLTQLASVQLLREWGLSWQQVAELSSARPARWIGAQRVGRIAPGALAHWLEVGDDESAQSDEVAAPEYKDLIGDSSGRPVALWLEGVRHEFS